MAGLRPVETAQPLVQASPNLLNEASRSGYLATFRLGALRMNRLQQGGGDQHQQARRDKRPAVGVIRPDQARRQVDHSADQH